MQLLNSVTLEVKRSKFIAYFYHIQAKEEIKVILGQLKKEHKKARHIPYAYFLDTTAGKSDDKEPSNTAGTPIFYVLENSCYRNHAIFVVRYFGGIKLGAGGLMHSYRLAAKQVVECIKKTD